VNDMVDSVSEVSDAGGDTVSLDGTQTVSQPALVIVSLDTIDGRPVFPSLCVCGFICLCFHCLVL